MPAIPDAAATADMDMVRLLIPDTDPTQQFFTDSQISAFLALEGGVKKAAAQALDVLASNEAMVSKVIRTLDLQTDGAKLSAELRARASSLREQADSVDAEGSTFGLEIVDFNPSAWFLEA